MTLPLTNTKDKTNSTKDEKFKVNYYHELISSDNIIEFTEELTSKLDEIDKKFGWVKDVKYQMEKGTFTCLIIYTLKELINPKTVIKKKQMFNKMVTTPLTYKSKTMPIVDPNRDDY